MNYCLPQAEAQGFLSKKNKNNKGAKTSFAALAIYQKYSVKMAKKETKGTMSKKKHLKRTKFQTK